MKGRKTFNSDSRASAGENAAILIKYYDLGDATDVSMSASGAEPSGQTGFHAPRTGESYVQGELGRPNISLPLVAVSQK